MPVACQTENKKIFTSKLHRQFNSGYDKKLNNMDLFYKLRTSGSCPFGKDLAPQHSFKWLEKCAIAIFFK